MVAVILISFVSIAVLIAFAVGRQLYFGENESQTRLQSLKPVSLFAPDAKMLAEIEHAEHRRRIAEETERALAWASLVHFSELKEMPPTENKKIANDALEILTNRAERDEDIVALTSFALNHETLNVNQKLVDKFQAVWVTAPDLQKTNWLFELASRTNNADLFQSVFTLAEQFIKNDKLSGLDLVGLRELASSHFWLLSSTARMSGAGFWLKQKLNYN
jgi:chlorite dismutase